MPSRTSVQRNGYSENGLCSGTFIDCVIPKILIEDLFHPSFGASTLLEFAVLNVFLNWGDHP